MDENLRARVNLFAVLPLLEDLAIADPKAKKWSRRIKSPVTLSVASDPKLAVSVYGGADGVSVQRGARNEGITIEFRDAASLNAVFAGGKAIPRVRGALPRPVSLIAFGLLMKRMAQVIEGKNTAPATRALIVLGTIARCFEVLGNFDPGFAYVLDTNDAVLAWQVEPDGPAAYVTVDGGKWAVRRRAADADVAVTFDGVGGLMDLIEGRDTPRMAFFMGKIKPTGNAGLAMKVGFLMEEVSRFLNP